jgi:acyl dehydratase
MEAPARPASAAELRNLIGKRLGPTGWKEIGQERIGAFAEVTEDRQWIHVDPARAAAGPLGGTIAHGLLTLSLGPAMTEELISFDAFTHALNYGYGKVRFPAPVPVGPRLRMLLEVGDVEERSGGVQLAAIQTFERAGGEKPVCVAETLVRLVP